MAAKKKTETTEETAAPKVTDEVETSDPKPEPTAPAPDPAPAPEPPKAGKDAVAPKPSPPRMSPSPTNESDLSQQQKMEISVMPTESFRGRFGNRSFNFTKGERVRVPMAARDFFNKKTIRLQ